MRSLDDPVLGVNTLMAALERFQANASNRFNLDLRWVVIALLIVERWHNNKHGGGVSISVAPNKSCTDLRYLVSRGVGRTGVRIKATQRPFELSWSNG